MFDDKRLNPAEEVGLLLKEELEAWTSLKDPFKDDIRSYSPLWKVKGFRRWPGMPNEWEGRLTHGFWTKSNGWGLWAYEESGSRRTFAAELPLNADCYLVARKFSSGKYLIHSFKKSNRPSWVTRWAVLPKKTEISLASAIPLSAISEARPRPRIPGRVERGYRMRSELIGVGLLAEQCFLALWGKDGRGVFWEEVRTVAHALELEGTDIRCEVRLSEEKWVLELEDAIRTAIAVELEVY